MKILFLAPQPFFQERGTPIAVRLALEVLAARMHKRSTTGEGDRIDLLTYHEGDTISIPGTTIHRIKAPRFLSKIGPGISIKKLACDIIFLFAAIRLAWQNRSEQYELVHAVEESVFIAWLFRIMLGIPYIYDMDSSLALQVTEKWFLLKPFYPILRFFEGQAVKWSLAVAPVCDALAAIANRHGSTNVYILRDISLFKEDAAREEPRLRAEIGAASSDQLILYIGNLEPYQGIDLLLESFALVAPKSSFAKLVIIGGRENHIKFYQEKAKRLGIAKNVHLVGPRPLAQLDSYLLQADILASPRVRGNNTPMKIYSYLHSGKAIIATDLPTHSQVLDTSVSILCVPTPTAFAEGLKLLLEDAEVRQRIGTQGKKLAEERYTFDVFSLRLNELYDAVETRIKPSTITEYAR